MSKLNKFVIARHLDRAILTNALPDDLAAQATDLVADIDAGKGGIPAKVEALISTAWASTARAAAAAVKPADQRRALAALRAVGQLESQLGLAPEANTETEPVSDTETDTVSVTAWNAA